MATLRILVFGSTGAGKTSLCNVLSGHQMPVSDSARGVTFRSFEYPPFEYGNQKIVLVDTIGLNESDKGHIRPVEAVEQLVDLITRSVDGYNLLVHVMRVPRIMEAHKGNYEFFVKTFTQGRIPCLLIATGCENSDPLSDWSDKNMSEFAVQGFDYKDVIATCFGSGGRLEAVYAPLRTESREKVLEAIAAYAASEPVELFDDEPGSFIVLRRVWNWFCEWIGHPEMVVVIDSGIQALLTRIGVPPAMAKVLATGVTVAIKPKAEH